MKKVILVLLAEIGFWGWFLVFLIMIPLIFTWVFTMADIFAREDLPGWAKALWVIVVIILPLLGMLVYFIVPPRPPESWPWTELIAGEGPGRPWPPTRRKNCKSWRS